MAVIGCIGWRILFFYHKNVISLFCNSGALRLSALVGRIPLVGLMYMKRVLLMDELPGPGIIAHLFFTHEVDYPG